MKKLLYTLLAVSIIFSACEEDTPLPAPNNNNNNSALAIGDTHQGGIIFYLNANGGGLIAAPEDLEGTYEWGCLLTQVEDGGNLTQIGTGYQNTLDIVDQDCLTEFGGIPAAQAAKDAQINGFNDWYLPSRDELYQMYLKIGQGGLDIGSSEYWSSSESNFSNSWIVSFSVGLTESISKNSFSTKVRVIRSF